MDQLISRGLPDICIGIPHEVFRRDLIHRPASSAPLPGRIRLGAASTEPELPPGLRAAAFRGRATSPPDIKGLVGDPGAAPTCVPTSCALLKGPEDRRPASVARRSRNAGSDRVAISTSGSLAAFG